MEVFETVSEVKISGEEFARLLRDMLIEKGIVAPLGHPIRDKYSWKFKIDKHKDSSGYDVTVYRYENEEEPEPEKPYEAGEGRDPEVAKIINE